MTGFEIRIDASALDRSILPRLEALADLDRHSLLDAVGGLGVSQTQRRIAEEKTDPDGHAWPANRRGGSILVLEGHLLGSISHDVRGEEVAWGSNLVYAAIHQEGGTIKAKGGGRLHFTVGNQHFFPKEVTIPKRAYLGLSTSNMEEIVDAIHDWITETLQ